MKFSPRSRTFLTASLSMSSILLSLYLANSVSAAPDNLGDITSAFDPNSIPESVSDEDLKQFLRMTGKGDVAEGITDYTKSNPLQPTNNKIRTFPSSSRPNSSFRNLTPVDNSPLEKAYTSRLDQNVSTDNLMQFGYDAFSNSNQSSADVIGSVQANYVMGVGDKIAVTFRGQENKTGLYVVDREGKIVIDKLKPIDAAGRSFADFQADLNKTVDETFGHTEVYTSVSQLRQIAVSVVGQVKKPNSQLVLTSLSSLMDALSAAGGIDKNGSLRRIQLIRGGQTTSIDLYDVLIGGNTSAVQQLMDGDQIIVPPLGQTVAIAGYTKRPAIYELPSEKTSISARELLELSGGSLTRIPLALMYYQTLSNGKQKVQELYDLDNISIKDGEMLVLRPREQANVNVAELKGEVKLPGAYALSGTGSLKRIISNSDRLTANTYLPFAVILSPDRGDGGKRFKGVDLQPIVSGGKDFTVKTGDQVIVLSVNDIDYLTSEDVVSVLNGDRIKNSSSDTQKTSTGFNPTLSPPSSDTLKKCAGLSSLMRARSASDAGFFSAAQAALAGRKLSGGQAECPAIFNEYPDLLPYLIAQSVLLTEGVSKPGFYPVVDGTSKAGVARYALPLSNSVSSGTLRSGMVAAVKSEQVNVVGHVRYAGSRPLSSASSLKELLQDDSLLLDNPYMLFGLVLRQDSVTKIKRYEPFSPVSVLKSQSNKSLQKGDTVIFFSLADIRKLTEETPYELEKKDWDDNIYNLGTGKKERTKDFDNRRLMDEYSSQNVIKDALTGQSSPVNRNPFIDALKEERQNQARNYDPTDPFQVANATRSGNNDDINMMARNGMLQNSENLPLESQWGALDSEGLQKDRKKQIDQTHAIQSLTGISPSQLTEIQSVLRDYLISLEGGVLRAGHYPILPKTRLKDLLDMAGGTTQSADMKSIEVTYSVKDEAQGTLKPSRKMYDMTMAQNMTNVFISPMDTVRVSSMYQQIAVGTLKLMGEVRRPGVYHFSKGETLASVIERAGGLTAEAYPQGAIFSRKSIRETEKRAFERSAFEIDRQVTSMSQSANSRRQDDILEQMKAAQALSNTLRRMPTIGRTQVTADPAVLAAYPDKDILLEEGDILSIPQRPISITVSGEVLSPSSLRQDPDKDVMDYIKMAGGMTKGADESRIFIMLPDGQTKPAGSSIWSAYPDDLPPGSTIVVPSDPKPYEWLDFTTGITDLLSKLAISAASLSILSRD